MQPLRYYYKDLKRKFGNDLRSAYEVNGVEKKFIGFEIESNGLLADVEIQNIKQIIGESYRVVFQPNNEKIYIE